MRSSPSAYSPVFAGAGGRWSGGLKCVGVFGAPYLEQFGPPRYDRGPNVEKVLGPSKPEGENIANSNFAPVGVKDILFVTQYTLLGLCPCIDTHILFLGRFDQCCHVDLSFD